MASIPIFNKSGAEVGKYEIDAETIAPKISQQLLHDVVVMYQASARQGTHRTKDRSEHLLGGAIHNHGSCIQCRAV